MIFRSQRLETNCQNLITKITLMVMFITGVNLTATGVLSAQNLDNWTNFTSNEIFRDITETQDYYWIGTEGGLLRLDKDDGLSKTHFNRGNTPLLSNRINSIDYDSASNTLALAMSPGVQFYNLDDESWETFDNTSSPFPMKNINRFRYGYDDSWWISMENGLAHYNPETGAWKLFGTQNSNLNATPLTRLMVDHNKNTWAVNYAIHKIDSAGNWTSIGSDYFNTGISKILDIAVDSAGTLWAVNRYHLFELPQHSDSLQIYSHENSSMTEDGYYSRLCVDSENRIVLAGKTGNFGTGHFPVFDGESWTTLSGEGIEDLMRENIVSDIYSEADGSFLVAYVRKGLYTNRRDIWGKIETNQADLAYRWVNQVVSDNLNRIWFKMDWDQLTMFDGTAWHDFSEFEEEYGTEYFFLAQHPSKDRMYITGNVTGYWDADLEFHEIDRRTFHHLKFDSSGTAWATKDNDLYFLAPDSTNWQLFDPDPELHFGFENNFDIGPDGNIWAISWGELLHINTSDSTWKEFDFDVYMDYRSSWGTIAVDADSRVWVTADAGLVVKQREPEVQYDFPIGIAMIDTAATDILYTTENSNLPHNAAYDLHTDKHGYLWATTEKGLAKFDGDDWITFNTENSRIADNYTLALTTTPSGDIWVASKPPNDYSSYVYVSRFHNGVALNTEDDEQPQREFADETPQHIHLKPNYPNPFNPSTTLQVSLPDAQDVTLEVFNSLGQRVSVIKDGLTTSGNHEFRFNASHLPSGLYFFRLTGDFGVETQKGILLK
jgi:ligand-binding sensor domain-containing protein